MKFDLTYHKLSKEEYQLLKKNADENPELFWQTQAEKRIHWQTPFTQVCDTSFNPNDVRIRWFQDGKLNASYNAIDRHCLDNPEKTALIWENDTGTQTKSYSFSQLKDEVEIFTASLRKLGITQKDCVVIYMPMIPEAIFAMLACARIGAMHCVVFAGFSSTALEARINDCKAQFIITADEGKRAGKIIPLKQNVDKALENCPKIKKCLVIQHTHNSDIIYGNKDVQYHDIKKQVSATDGYYDIVASEHPLFILYTSGSTGKPKGLLHSTGGYCVYSSFTHELSFNAKPDDVFFCTADIGWITGHSYITYGPLINGSTIVLFEGVPTFPDAGRLWEICDKHQVTTLYTAPTALRTLMSFGNDIPRKYNLKSLRVLGTVGEPINPEVFDWYAQEIGKNNCPIVDTWWQTETGGHIIVAPAFLENAPAGYAGKALPSLNMALLDETGKEITQPHHQGYLVIKKSWPGQAQSIYKNHKRFIDTYFSQFPNHYTTGDGAYYDNDGNIRITGRIDDILNVSGHRLGTAELESAFVSHKLVSEAAVVGYDHAIKGQAIYAFVTLMQGINPTTEIEENLKKHIRQEISAIAVPDKIQFTTDLPKTRSGKIMRRILKKIANRDFTDFGDITTLSDPKIVETIAKDAQRILV